MIGTGVLPRGSGEERGGKRGFGVGKGVGGQHSQLGLCRAAMRAPTAPGSGSLIGLWLSLSPSAPSILGPAPALLEPLGICNELQS